MEQAQDVLDRVSQRVDVFASLRYKIKIQINLDQFYEILLNKFGTNVCPGDRFEEDRRHMRIKYIRAKTEAFEKRFVKS